MSEDEELEKDVDSILDQLKQQSKSLKEAKKNPPPTLKKEDMEQFIIDKASEIVHGCVDVIGVIQDEIRCAPDPKLIESGATFINAFTSALDALSKLEINSQKIKAQKEMKEMDISVKLLANEETESKGVYISREELIKGLLDHKPEEPVKQLNPPSIDV